MYATEFENHRVSLFKPSVTPSDAKAIVVAAGGPFVGNDLWDITEYAADSAYIALVQRGLTVTVTRMLAGLTLCWPELQRACW